MGTHPIFESDFDCLTEKYNDVMYVLDFMGLAVLDPEFSRPMLPWVVREVIFRADPRVIKLSIKDDQIEFQELNAGEKPSQPRKVENSFHSDGYKIKDVYHP